MGKYEPLGQFLRQQRAERISMTFAEIEHVIGKKLPASKKQRAWWSNNPDNNVMTREWIEAGFETEAVNTKAENLVFRRKGGSKRTTKVLSDARGQHPIFGCMKGWITLAQGFDPTAPTGEDWEIGYLADDRRK